MASAVAGITAEKRRRALYLLRNSNFSRLTADAALTYAVGLVVCDDEGTVRKADVDAGLQDPDTLAVARELMRRARS